MGNARFYLSNIKMYDMEGNEITAVPSGSLELTPLENEEIYNIPMSARATFTLKAKRKGNLIEKCLYYGKSKKKRIRKKYNIYRRILKIGV